MPKRNDRPQAPPRRDPAEEGSAAKPLQKPNPPSVDPEEEGSAARQQR